ncbi:group XIIB secretory phospholipase A2-like protein isoform X1 [Thunnus albacares]|uniref:group XIIB secretory phospholipase A2-like protein isoform X1 n=1 Tax=Thunnus albacares TaxID=8236 RepID=UPI001CF69D5E|nr:group XIIB secretory phospholipase A2-like protein isoform X1 [Thunnus albacares]XP_044229343.1 group XIIB secretory phospholipase A2-like protein isoform X1 [Thunnus albacares]
MLLRTVVLLLLCMSSGMCATLGHYQTPAQEEEAAAVDPQITDGVVAAASEQEVVAAADAKVGDSPETKEAKIPAVDNPAADKPEVDVPVADDTTAKEPEKDSDRPAGDTPAMEAPVQQQPSEEELNEIRPVQTDQSLNRPLAHEDSNSWGMNSIRNGFQSVHGYFDSLVELVGGRNGVCEYRCRYGKLPQPRPGYQLPEPNGCSTSLVGFQVNAAFDLGIPAMTKCCNELDVCYDTCGTSKNNCDSRLRSCLHGICSDLKKSLGFVSKVQACESMADAVYNTVWTLGCRPYMNSQRAACVCEEEEKDEL